MALWAQSLGTVRCGHAPFISLRPGRNGRYNADDIFKCIFLKENVWIPTKISLKFVPKGPINNITALVQIMAWRRPGDKPLSEPMLIFVPTHICVTRPQWVILFIPLPIYRAKLSHMYSPRRSGFDSRCGNYVFQLWGPDNISPVYKSIQPTNQSYVHSRGQADNQTGTSYICTKWL